VLLKDDGGYPYICASEGNAFPSFYSVPRRQRPDSEIQVGFAVHQTNDYPSFSLILHTVVYSVDILGQTREINTVLEAIEEKHDLRTKRFAARHGDGSKAEYYGQLFDRVFSETFEGKSKEMLPM
jgi:hypothetical protein